MLQIHLAVFLFGFAGLFGKFIHADPSVIVFGRTFFAGVALLLGLILTGGNPLSLSRRDWAAFIVSGFVLAAHWFAFFQSVQVSSVAIALLTFSTFPLFTAFLEPFFFGERLRPFDVGVAVIVGIGIAMIVPSFDFSNNATRGVFWGMISGLTFAVLSIFNRRQVRKYPAMNVAFFQLSLAAAFSLPAVFLSRSALSLQDIFLLLILGVACTALAQALFIGSLRHIPARTASVITGLEPAYGILLAFLLLGEAPGWRTLPGGLIILAAVFLATARRTAQE